MVCRRPSRRCRHSLDLWRAIGRSEFPTVSERRYAGMPRHTSISAGVSITS